MSGDDDLTIVTPKRRIMWEPKAKEPETPPPLATVKKPDELQKIVNAFSATPDLSTTSPAVVFESKRTYKQRTGNGHKSEKTRDLFDYEKDIIKEDLFLAKNGQISNDDCVVFRNIRINDIAGNSAFNTIAIFQITGYVSVLHTRVAEGRLLVSNLSAYEEWMRTKYGRL